MCWGFFCVFVCLFFKKKNPRNFILSFGYEYSLLSVNNVAIQNIWKTTCLYLRAVVINAVFIANETKHR